MFPANMGNAINCPVHSAKDPGLKWLLISLHVMAMTLVDVWFSHHHISSAKGLLHFPVNIHLDWNVLMFLDSFDLPLLCPQVFTVLGQHPCHSMPHFCSTTPGNTHFVFPRTHSPPN
jgi:hypothetical protein